MQTPTRNAATNVNTLVVDWIALEGDETGSSPIDSYNLQWDKNTNAVEWEDLQGSLVLGYSTATTGSFTANVLPGTQYKMRVRAHNVHGWSEWSPILIIRSTGLPEEPAPPVTTLTNG